MGSEESILGMIHHAYGSSILDLPADHTIIVTEIRAIFVKIPTEEKQTGQILYNKSLDWIISYMSTISMDYEEMEDFKIIKTRREFNLFFRYDDNKYSFDIPLNQYQMVNHFAWVWHLMDELQYCPECNYRLFGPYRFCEQCNKEYNRTALAPPKDPVIEEEKEQEQERIAGLILFVTGLSIAAVIFFTLPGPEALICCVSFPFLLMGLGSLMLVEGKSVFVLIGVILIQLGGALFAVNIYAADYYARYNFDPPVESEPNIWLYVISIALLLSGFLLIVRFWKEEY